MKTTRTRVPVGDHRMSVTLLEGSEPGPGLVLLHEIFGANYAMREIAGRFVELGYTVAIPDLFHRAEPDVELGYTPEARPRAMELLSTIQLEAALADVDASIVFLEAHPALSRGIGLLGFCLGGRLALLGAELQGVSASVAFYPVRTELHRDVLKRLRTPVQVHAGTADSHISPEVLDMLRTDLAEGEHELWIYEGGKHAFYNPHHPGFDAAHADPAHERTKAFLQKHLPL